MKRKLLALVLSSISISSFAEVMLYGKLATGLENDQFQDTSVPGAGSIQDFGSYFGIKGSDPVYGQTSVIWQIENKIDITSGQAYTTTSGGGTVMPNPIKSTPSGAGKVSTQMNTLASGNSFLGLQGSWGRLTLGNLNNYGSTNMGGVDTFNSANGVQGFGTYSRYSKRLPAAIRYDSPTWNGFGFGALYSFNNLGQTATSGITNSNTLANMNGNYSGGVYNLGVGWSANKFAINLSTSIWQDVGTYITNTGLTLGVSNPSTASYPNAGYNYAYINTLEISYEDPDGIFAGAGFQTSSGLGWSSWANSGGSFNNVALNGPASVLAQLQNEQYQTQEFAISAGYHLGAWTPKIGYAYGNNLMINGNPWQVANGVATQIPNSGYQTATVELDWNITPRTLVFVNYGQVWYGSTLQNVTYAAASTSAPTAPASTADSFYQNQSSAALGFSHTF